MAEERYLYSPIVADLPKKMVFLAGPRQVGKTTLAKRALAQSGPGVYLTWDRRGDRQQILKAQWPSEPALVVLDELHKYRFWKRWIKGEFDAHRDRLRFLVTGSARLDVYRRGGDSLQGRYHHYRLHPFSAAEVEHRNLPTVEPFGELEMPESSSPEPVQTLLRFSGFPEPFLAASDTVLRRWQKDRADRFFREDVRDLESVQDLSSLQILADLLAERVASPLSLNSLREDLEVSHRTVTHWMGVFDRLYFVARIRPYTARLPRGLRKMPKVYLWDWSLVSSPGPRFENLVAMHLLKFCHFLEDTQGYRTELHYLRDTAGREVDFLVTCNQKPWFAVETKSSDAEIDPSLHYFRDRLKIPWTYQVVLSGQRDYVADGVRCLPAHKLLAALV